MTYQALNETLSSLLEKHHKSLDTRAILIDTDAIAGGVPLLKQHLPTDGVWLIAMDENTQRVAGDALIQALEASGQAVAAYHVPTHEGEKFPMCDDDAVEAYRQAIAADTYIAGIAVGSGTINDIVKLGAHLAGKPMACVGTAPSMNGYTSKIAAVLSNGVKTTNPCTAPVVVIGDVNVMAQSPERMIASGLGDLISKPVSNADWQLSAQLNGTFHSDEAMEVIELGAAMLDGVAPGLAKRDTQATAGLVASLMVSGLAMSIAGSSSPASGGEHLISHYIDMTAHAFDQPYDFHGCQVGVGTLTTALFYEKLAALNPDDIDVEACVAALPSWDDYKQTLAEHFGKLYDAVEKHAKPAYPDQDTLRRRLTTLKTNWSTIMPLVQRTLRTKDAIEAELLEALGPVRYAQLDVAKDRAYNAMTRCKDIRNRYTILHLAWELGVLETWSDDAIDALYE